MPAGKGAGDGTKAAIAGIKKKFKGASVRRMADGATSALKEVIPLGIDPLDNWVLGCGGLPVGRAIELYAEEGAGKTSLGFAALAAAQRAGGMAVLYETERRLVPERADIFGVNRQDVVLGEPDTMEDLLGQLRQLLKLIPDGVGPNLIVWDSLAATATEKEVKGKPQPGDHARQMSQNVRVMAGMLFPKRCHLFVINQLRHKIGVLYGPTDTTPGGNALKYYSSQRLQLWRGAGFKEGPDTVGHRITVKAMKNSLAMPFRKASVRLDYRFGFDDEWSVIEFAKDRELIPEGLKLTPETYARALEALQGMPGYFPNVVDYTKPNAEEPKPPADGDVIDTEGEPVEKKPAKKAARKKKAAKKKS